MSDYNQNNNTVNNNNSGDSEGCSEEWLNLSLGRNEDLEASDLSLLLNSTYNKIFSCNFCKRKFCSLQALGGHQNAHRRERGALRRCQPERLMTMGDSPVNKPMIRFGVQLHSLVHKPSKDSKIMVSRFSDAIMGNGLPRIPDDLRFSWPGSFHMASNSPKQTSDLLKVDLNLRL